MKVIRCIRWSRSAIAFAGTLVSATCLFAQWSLTVNVPNPYPSPIIADWEHNPGIVSIIVNYAGPQPATAKLVSRLETDEHGNLASGTSAEIGFSAPFPRIVQRDNRDFWNYRDLRYNAQYKEQVIRTGELMEGSYTLYVKLVDARTGSQLGSEQSARFWIVSLNPPELQAPADRETVQVRFPLFRWSAVGARPGMTVRYSLKLCEVLPGQTPQNAINNRPHYSTTISNLTTFTYPGAPALVSGKRYAWRVTAEPGGASSVAEFLFAWQLQQPPPPPQHPIVVTTMVQQCHSPYIADYFTSQQAVVVRLHNTSSETYQVRLLAHLWGRHLAWRRPGQEQEPGGRGPSFDTVSMVSDSLFRPGSAITIGPGATVEVPGSYLRQFLVCDSTTVTAYNIRWETIPPPTHPETIGVIGTRRVPSFFRYLEFRGLPESTAIRGNGLPNGRYRLSFRALGQLTGVPLSAADPAGCDTFEVSQFDPPVIVSPVNRDTLSRSTPARVQFAWTRPAGVNQLCTLNYRVRVVAIPNPDSVDIEEAMRRSVSAWDTAVMRSTQATWTSWDSARLAVGQWYAVQVQVFFADRAGGFVDQGRSQIVAFRYGTRLPRYVLTPPTYVRGRLLYHFKDAPGHENAPVRSANLSLRLHKNWRRFPAMVDTGSVLGYALTDANGDFEFDLQFFRETLGVWRLAGTEFEYSWVARIHVQSPYYFLSPDTSVVFLPGTTENVGTLISYVRDYRLDVLLPPDMSKGAQYATQALPGVPVYVLDRSYPNSSFPTDDGAPNPEQPVRKVVGGISYRVVAVALSDDDGVAHFQKLIYRNSGPYPGVQYYIWADPGVTKDYAYWTTPHPVYDSERRRAPSLDPRQWKENSSHRTVTVFDSLLMRPYLPQITGEVYGRRGEEYPLPLRATVTLIRGAEWPGLIVEKSSTLDENPGEFRFTTLPIHSYLRRVWFKCPGFITQMDTVNRGVPLKMGQRLDMGRIILEPGVIVKGSVVNEDGTGVESWVTFKDGITYTASVPGLVMPVPPARFAGRVEYDPSLYCFSCTLVVNPKNEFYFSETVAVDLPTQPTEDTVDLGRFTVERRKHRIEVHVLRRLPALGGGFMDVGVPNARVRVEDVTGDSLTRSSGVARFEFDRSTNLFTLRVAGPPGENLVLVTRRVSVSAPPSKDFVRVDVLLDYGASVIGHVTANGAPVESARVFLDGNPSPPIEAYTDQSGAFWLTGVPKQSDSLLFRAVKSGYVGARGRVNTESYPRHLPRTCTLDFVLNSSPDLDLTTLLGFNIEVESLSRISSSVSRITGAFVELPSNSQFAVADSHVRLRFHAIDIVADSARNGQGISFARPVLDSVALEPWDIGLHVLGGFAGKLSRTTGRPLVVTREPGLGGVVKGYAGVDPASLVDPNIEFPAGIGIAGRDQSGTLRDITAALTASGAAPLLAPQGLTVCQPRYAQRRVQYRLLGFAAQADSLTARLHADTLILPSSIRWRIRHMTAACSLAVGTVRLRRTGYLPALEGGNDVTWPLQRWQMTASDWTLNSSTGLTLSGHISTDSLSGSLRVPFEKMYVLPQDSIIRCKDFGLRNLKFNRILPVRIRDTTMLRFGWDELHRSWGLTALPPEGGGAIAVLTGLTKMTPDSLLINNLYLLSKSGDSSDFTLVSGQHFQLCHLLDFVPTMLIGSGDHVRLAGVVDLGIPQVPRVNGGAIYTKDGRQTVFRFQAVDPSWTANGASFILPGFPADQWPQQLTDWQGLVKPLFYARGLALESLPDGSGLVFKFRIDLYHNPDSTWIRVVEDGQRFYPQPTDQSKYLDSIHGGAERGYNAMVAKYGNWDFFRFGGWAKNWNSIVEDGTGNHLRFKVTGEVKAENQTLKIKKMGQGTGGGGGGGGGPGEGAFPGMNITYNAERREFCGTINIAQKVQGTEFDMYAEILVGEEGWYFLGGGKAAFPICGGFGGEVWTALLLGDYDMNNHIRSKFQEYSLCYEVTGELPTGFRTDRISGFYFECGAAVTWGADFEFHFGIVDAYITARMGTDLAFGIDFDDAATTVSVQFMGFAQIEAGLGASFVVVCAGIQAGAMAEVHASGEFSEDDWWVEGGGSFELWGRAYLGVGLPCWAVQGGCGGACYTMDTGRMSVGMRFDVKAGSRSDGEDVSFAK
jgi:hypothetical protein